MVLENMSSPPCAWIPPRLSFKGPFIARSAPTSKAVSSIYFHPRCVYYLPVRVDSTRLPFSVYIHKERHFTPHSPGWWHTFHVLLQFVCAQWTRTPLTGWVSYVCLSVRYRYGASSSTSSSLLELSLCMSLRFFPRFLITFVYLRMRWLGSTSWLLLVVRSGVDDEGGWM